MGHKVAGLLTAEDDHSEGRIVLDALDEGAKLVDGVGVDQVDWTVVEGHPPVGGDTSLTWN